MRTIEEAKQWGVDNKAACMESYSKCKEIQFLLLFMESSKIENLWMAGCWLKDVLCNAGATIQQVSEIQFAHGQTSVYRDPWEVAVSYANEFESNKSVQDKPGELLAIRLTEQYGGGIS